MENKFNYALKNKVRFVTATSLFDGHDVSINIFRRLLQQAGVEVIHLGHNRSVREIIETALEEDAQALCVSCYQGGHMEFFCYLREMADKLGRADLKIFGGGGGVIIPTEIEQLEKKGITKIYSPEDGMRLGLEGI
ncbi:MAG: cobalamin-dependent protein, partial [Silvanigrellaceae bacterium]|nr:cobalamin-dependent protein [Silvanigrellaceae bacterium]